MKIAVIYPPIRHQGEYPLLSQNRQFKYTNSAEVRIYPVIMASLATMLKEDGNEILYLDGINERMGMDEFQARLRSFGPQAVFLETKAPIVKKHWEYIDSLKNDLPKCKVVLMGDHVSYFPGESLEKSSTDYVIRHGDYDFLGRDLIRHLAGRKAEIPGSIYWKETNGSIKHSGYAKFYDLDSAPEIDRDLTKFHIYGEAYLYHPVAYILSGRGCGGSNCGKPRTEKYRSSLPGRCIFCIWQYSYWKAGARLRDPEKVALEIKHLVEQYKVREVFDDNESGAIWDKQWMMDFYSALVRLGVAGKVRISSNARADSLIDADYCGLLKKCGYRLLKIGVESGNNRTLKILKKDETTEIVKKGIKNAKNHGMVVLMTTMVGYPWEDLADTERTWKMARELMLYRTHFGDSLQASIVVPYPGTPLYQEALKNGWFLVNPKDYEQFDMAHPILKAKVDTEYWCKRIWRIHLDPIFLIKSFFTLRSLKDLTVALRGFTSLLGHLKDYRNK